MIQYSQIPQQRIDESMASIEIHQPPAPHRRASRRPAPALSAALWTALVVAGQALGVSVAQPVAPPDPRSRSVPELLCTGTRATTVPHDTLEAVTEGAPLRLRINGNLLYLGQSTNAEKFVGLISRTDKRRWTAGTGTLILDDALQSGVWVRLEAASTRIASVRCQPLPPSP